VTAARSDEHAMVRSPLGGVAALDVT